MNYSSNSEFDLVKRVQITNEVPPVALWPLMPSGLRNDFWKYFIGTSNVDYEVSSATKTVNGTVAASYGPSDSSPFHSIELEGVILPEFDLFLHELYRYLDTPYPDHPDFLQLLTANEINDAFTAAAASIGYVPNYKFLSIWSQSMTGLTDLEEELKWKIRDLRGAAFRRKFFGSYSGYKLIFAAMGRHGSVYMTGTYQPQLPPFSGSLDQTPRGFDYSNKHALKMFRLIDYYGVNDDVYRASAQITFTGLITPGDSSTVYEARHVQLYGDSNPSVIPSIAPNIFVFKGTDTVASVTSAENGYDFGVTGVHVSGAEVAHYLKLSAGMEPTLRTYSILRGGVDILESLKLTPHPVNNGEMALSLEAALALYPSVVPPNVTSTSALFWDSSKLNVSDLLQDAYLEQIVTYYDQAQVVGTRLGTIKLLVDPNSSSAMQSFPVPDSPWHGLEVFIKTFSTDASGTIIPLTDSVFLQGSLVYATNSSGVPTAATFTLAAIPEVNPMTGATNNRELLLPAGSSVGNLSAGQTVRICDYTSGVWTENVNVAAWVSIMHFGDILISNQQTKGKATVGTFSYATFDPWRARAGVQLTTDTALPGYTTLEGTIDLNLPTLVTFAAAEADYAKINALSPGDLLQGPGVVEGTVVASTTSRTLTLSAPATQAGTFTFRLTLRHARTAEKSDTLAYRTQLFSLYPDQSSSAFNALWPSAIWPSTSLGYLEGFKDASFWAPISNPYDMIDKTSGGAYVRQPAAVSFDQNLFLEMSLDRVLYHPNTMGGNQSLADIPWFEYLENLVSQSKRATEKTFIGAQLNLSADTSGLYTIVAANKYSDPATNAKFITISSAYKQDSTPTTVRIGSGGSSKAKLFVSIADLLLPTVYGNAAPYETNFDLDNLPAGVSLKKGSQWTDSPGPVSFLGTMDGVHLNMIFLDASVKSTQLTVGSVVSGLNVAAGALITRIGYIDATGLDELGVAQTSPGPQHFITLSAPCSAFTAQAHSYIASASTSSSTSATAASSLDNVVFEVPVGEYEYAASFTDPNNATNVYQALAVSFYEQAFRSIPADLSNRELRVLSPAFYTAARMPTGWSYKGAWSPTEVITQVGNTTVVSPNYPSTVGAVVNDYYTVTTALTIGSVTFAAGDWLVYSSTAQAWKPKHWLCVGAWSLTAIPTVANVTAMLTTGGTLAQWTANAYVYVVATINGTGYKKGDWLVFVDGTTAAKIVRGDTALNLAEPLTQTTMSSADFTTLTSQRNLQYVQFLTEYAFPRKFMTSGSVSMKLRLDPGFQAKDMAGTTYNLTEGPLYWDSSASNFYVENTNGGATQKHFVDFHEPIYYKNLMSLVGTVYASEPGTVYRYTGQEFPASSLTLSDTAVSATQALIRSSYEASLENSYFSHYVDIVGVVSNAAPADAIASDLTGLTGPFNNRILIPALSSPLASVRQEDFRIALLGMAANDSIKSTLPTVVRKYDPGYENQYFKNLLTLVAQVNRTDPQTLVPVNSDAESLRAFNEGLRRLQTGDYIYETYLPGGTKLAPGAALPNIDSTHYISTVSYGPGVWLVGSSNGSTTVGGVWISGSASFGSWTKKTWVSGWTGGIVSSRYDATNNIWWVGGYAGQAACSFDNGLSWTKVGILGTWSAGSVKSFAFEKDFQMVVGGNGQGAWRATTNGILPTVGSPWTAITLPQNSSLPTNIPVPANNPTGTPTYDTNGGLTWGTGSVNAVVKVGNVWIIAGDNGRIAWSTAPNTTFALAATPQGWGTQNGTAYIRPKINDLLTDGTSVAALCDDGSILYSTGLGSTPVGQVWAVANFGSTTNSKALYAGTVRSGQWIAVGQDGASFKSADGLGWTSTYSVPTSAGTLYCATLGAGRVAYAGVDNVISFAAAGQIVTNTISVAQINTTDGAASISLSSQPIPLTSGEWNATDSSKLVLLSFYTLGSIDQELAGIPIDLLDKFTDPQTGQLYTMTAAPVSSYRIANRIYMPRSNSGLNSEFNKDGSANPHYIGVGGYPLYTEDPAQYALDSSSNPQTFTGMQAQKLYYADVTGNYVDATWGTLKLSSFTQTLDVTDQGTVVRYQDVRTAAYRPQYVTYSDWLAGGNDVIAGITALTTYAGAKVLRTINKAGRTPYLVLSTAMPALAAPYNAVTFGILPANPVPVALTGVPHYTTDSQAADNLGIAANQVGSEVYYMASPLQPDVNSVIQIGLLNTVSGANVGLIGDNATAVKYSISPVRNTAAALSTSSAGAIVLTLSADGRTYATIAEAKYTGIYFQPKGYGYWALMNTLTDTDFPWNYDPKAFMHVVDAFTGLETGAFVYLQNSRGDAIHLCNSAGILIRDAQNNPIKVPAPRYMTFQALLNTAGSVVLRNSLTVGTTTKISNISPDYSYFTLTNPVTFPAGTSEMQVQFNLLTIAPVAPTGLTKDDPTLFYKLTAAQLATFAPDRVCYKDASVPFTSAYPTYASNPALYEIGKFTNANGAQVYLCNAAGYYVNESGTRLNDIASYISPQKPIYLLCRDWYKAEFYVAGYEDNPYWQYLHIEDVLDPESHIWSTQARIFRRIRGASGTETVLQSVSDADAYIWAKPGFSFTTSASSMVSKPVAFLDHESGEMCMLLAANSAYDKRVVTSLDQDKSQYGISFTSTFGSFLDSSGSITDMFSATVSNATSIKAELLADYTVNSHRNYASSTDTSIVAISELGVFNAADQMIAYATFPPIIYDSSRHHVSFNIFIKKGSFSPLASS
jgi:hypothetical protein